MQLKNKNLVSKTQTQYALCSDTEFMFVQLLHIYLLYRQDGLALTCDY